MSEKNPLIKKGWLRALIFFIAFLASEILFQGIAAFLLSRALNVEIITLGRKLFLKENIHYLILMQSIMALGSLLITWIFIRFINKSTMMSLGFALKGRLRDILLGLLLGISLISIGFIILKITGQLTITGIEVNFKVTFYYFILCILIAFKEEVITRGYILGNLMDSMNKYMALIISALLFAVFHGMNPNMSLIGIINIFLGGIILGISYIHTRNLWFPIAFHTAWNFAQGPLYGFAVSGLKLESIIKQELNGNDIITGGKFGLEGSILATIFVIVFTVIIHLLASPKRTNT